MQYSFDRMVDRKKTNDLKWRADNMLLFGFHANEDTIPMWLADTDFPCAPVIVEALKTRVEKEIYGYCAPTAPFYQSICFWMQQRFQWEIDPGWVIPTPSVVAGINIAIRSFTNAGEGVIVQTPVYEPFFKIVTDCNRTVRNNPLLCIDGRYEMDFDALEKLAAASDVTLMILCSPHNPVGRVWRKEELQRVAAICIQHDVVLVTDEIHADIVYTGHTHLPLLALNPDYESHIIHLSAPSKTFNIAGLKMSYAMIPNQNLRKSFNKTLLAMSLNVKNTFGIEALTAAYSPAGMEWYLQELAYLEENRNFVETFLQTKLNGQVRMSTMEGTFLSWMDCTRLHITEAELMQRINVQANVICIPGSHYGHGGADHFRFNIGCPRATIERALERLQTAFADRL